MNVLVTGGAGYIGSHTAKRLHAAGHCPVTLDDLSTGHRDAVRWGPFVQGDLADTDLVRRTLRSFDIKAVIHFAASAYVGESMREPRKYLRGNVLQTMSLLDAMLETGVRSIIFSSTCAVYGLPRSLPIAEETPLRPINPYGDSKLFIERTLHWYGMAYNLSSIVLRYFNAAGADPDGEIGERHTPETHLIPLAVEAALGRRPPLEIYGNDYPTADGTAVRDYIHVMDLAQAHVAALAYLVEGGPSAAFNLGTGQGHSVREVLHAVEQVSGHRVPVKTCERRAGDPPALVAAATQAAQTLGWSPQFSDLSTLVRTAWDWHRTSGGAAESGPSGGAEGSARPA